ncbi:MAG: matrixin family metalloprotease [Candidatus Eisenbacteria bacterium]
MKFVKNRRFGRIVGSVAILILPLLLLTSSRSSVDRADGLLANAEFCGFDGGDRAFKCIHVPGLVDVCLHPDTDRATAEEILRNLPTYLGVEAAEGMGKDTYSLGGRWSYTATDGMTGVEGDPITITWGFVPDGTMADGQPSTLHADFTAQWGGSTAWMTKIRNAFDRWGWAVGISYAEVDDDGAVLPGSPGVLGTRGDCRLSGHSIDGAGGVLAYNWYPNGGDMVIDTDDTAYYYNPTNNYGVLKNVIAHEHGHGIGLGHVTPEDCTKLMEAYSCPPYWVGPQDDDIRGAQRYYGDIYENNDVIAEPFDLGTLVDTIFADYAAIERGSDEDWYRFTGSGTVRIEVDPIGSAYTIGNQGGPPPTYVRTDSINDPDFCLYTGAGVLLDSVYAMGVTETEIVDYALPAAGDYLIKVFRKGGSGNGIQRYEMTITVGSIVTDVQIADGQVPARALEFQVAPNPFNPLTTAKFFASAAGPYTVDVYDVSGRLARRIDGLASGAGWIDVPWNGKDGNGSDVASGVYLLRLTHGDRSETKRAVLVR